MSLAKKSERIDKRNSWKKSAERTETSHAQKIKDTQNFSHFKIKGVLSWEEQLIPWENS